MLLADFLKQGISVLERLYPSVEARSIMQLLCSERLGTKSYTHIVEPNYEITPQALKGLVGDMERLKEGEPIQYVLGRTEFCGFWFNVNPSVLIPRPETAQLVEMATEIAAPAMREGRNTRILDLCTGSGCICWSLAMKLPGSENVGVDISEEALELASTQNLSAKVAPVFVKADILKLHETPNLGDFDILVCNPPYVMEKERSQMHANVLKFEPKEALFVPDEDPLLFYRAVAQWSKCFMKKGGHAIVEINGQLGQETKDLFAGLSFSDVRLHKDFFCRDRFISYSR